MKTLMEWFSSLDELQIWIRSQATSKRMIKHITYTHDGIWIVFYEE